MVLNLSRKVAQAGANFGRKQHARRAAAESLMPAPVAPRPSANFPRSASGHGPSNLRGVLPALRSVLPAAAFGSACGYPANPAATSSVAPAGSSSEPVPLGSFGALGSLDVCLEEPAPADVAAWRSMMAAHGFCLPSMQPGASWGAVATSGGAYRQQKEELHPMFELLLL